MDNIKNSSFSSILSIQNSKDLEKEKKTILDLAKKIEQCKSGDATGIPLVHQYVQHIHYLLSHPHIEVDDHLKNAMQIIAGFKNDKDLMPKGFHRNIDHSMAESMLGDSPPLTYLIREKPEGQVAVSCVSPDAVIKHYLLLPTHDGKYIKKYDSPPIIYENIQDFIDRNPALFAHPLPSIPVVPSSLIKKASQTPASPLTSPPPQRPLPPNPSSSPKTNAAARSSQVNQPKWVHILSSHEKTPKFLSLINNYNPSLSREEWIRDVVELGLDILDPKNLLEMVDKLDPKNTNQLKSKVLSAIVNRIGHEWGVDTTVKVGGKKVSTIGSSKVYSHGHIASSVHDYFANVPKISANSLNSKEQQNILESLTKSMGYSFLEPSKARSALADYRAGKGVTIGTGWFKHGVEVTVQGDYVIYTNRGDYDQNPNKMIVYKIQDPSEIDEDFFKRIMCSEFDKSEIQKKVQMRFFEQDLPNAFKLKKVGTVPKADQVVGNCSFANAKGGFHALLIIHYLNQGSFNPNLMTPNNKKKWNAALTHATQIFKDWEFFNRQKGLDFYTAPETQKILFNENSPLSPTDHFKLLSEMSSQLAEANKYSKYSLDPYKGSTQIEKRVKEMQEKLYSFMKFSDLKIINCVVPPGKLSNETNYLMSLSEGAFIIRPGKEQGSFTVFVRTPRGVEQRSIQENYLYGSKHVKDFTLRDLYQYFDNETSGEDKITLEKVPAPRPATPSAPDAPIPRSRVRSGRAAAEDEGALVHLDRLALLGQELRVRIIRAQHQHQVRVVQGVHPGRAADQAYPAHPARIGEGDQVLGPEGVGDGGLQPVRTGPEARSAPRGSRRRRRWRPIPPHRSGARPRRCRPARARPRGGGEGWKGCHMAMHGRADHVGGDVQVGDAPVPIGLGYGLADHVGGLVRGGRAPGCRRRRRGTAGPASSSCR